MSEHARSPLKILRIELATLHVTPSPTGFDLLVVTNQGVQTAVAIDAKGLAALATEANECLSGDPMKFHAAGMRLSARLEGIKRK